MPDRTTRFARYLQRFWDRQLQGATYPGEWLHGRDEAALASEFRRDAQFEFSQARFLLRRPGTELAREVVDRLLPMPVESDAELLAGAIVAAGSTAQRVRITSAIGAVLTVFALVLRNVLRGR